MRQAFGPGALGGPGGSGWGRRWEGGSGWGTHVNPWMFPKSTTIKKNNNKNKANHTHTKKKAECREPAHEIPPMTRS